MPTTAATCLLQLSSSSVYSAISSSSAPYVTSRHTRLLLHRRSSNHTPPYCSSPAMCSWCRVCGRWDWRGRTSAIILAYWWTQWFQGSPSTWAAVPCIWEAHSASWRRVCGLENRRESCWHPRCGLCMFWRWSLRSTYSHVSCSHRWDTNFGNSPFTAEIYAKRDREREEAKKEK